MAKMCPFRKKKIATFTENDESINKAWEEQFLECLEEKCAAWTGSVCGIIHKGQRLDSENNKVAEKAPAKSREDNGAQNKNDNKLMQSSVKVLEARETKTSGNVRAWCQHLDDGINEAFIAKNGAGKVLLDSIGETVNAKYRRLSDGTAFAVFVEKVDS